MKTYKNVDQYIKSADAKYQDKLAQVREIVTKTIPKAEEGISYGMPAFSFLGKPLFYFAAMKGHLGLYPTSGPIEMLKKELVGFSTSKGCVRVLWGDTVPKGIIVKLLKERAREIKEELK